MDFSNKDTLQKAFEMSGGRTAHKAARHGHKLNGKLKRLQEQESIVDSVSRRDTGCDDASQRVGEQIEPQVSAEPIAGINCSSQEKKLKKRKSKKSKKRRCSSTEEMKDGLKNSPEIMEKQLDHSKSPKKKKKKRSCKDDDKLCNNLNCEGDLQNIEKIRT